MRVIATRPAARGGENPAPKDMLRIPITGYQLAVRSALAAGAAVALAELLALEHPIYAMLAAVIVTDLSPAKTRRLGLLRLVATVVGAACGATLSLLLWSGPWAVALSILVAMLVCMLLRAPESAKVAGYICGIVVLAHRAESWSYAMFRFLETALGIGTAWAISLVPPLIRIADDEPPGPTLG